MKTAFIGTYDKPPIYSRARTSNKTLSTRLDEKNHDIIVYGRLLTKLITEEEYKRVKSIKIKSFKNKELDFVYCRIISSLIALFKR